MTPGPIAQRIIQAFSKKNSTVPAVKEISSPDQTRLVMADDVIKYMSKSRFYEDSRPMAEIVAEIPTAKLPEKKEAKDQSDYWHFFAQDPPKNNGKYIVQTKRKHNCIDMLSFAMDLSDLDPALIKDGQKSGFYRYDEENGYRLVPIVAWGYLPERINNYNKEGI